jgi:hypothetical protein
VVLSRLSPEAAGQKSARWHCLTALRLAGLTTQLACWCWLLAEASVPVLCGEAISQVSRDGWLPLGPATRQELECAVTSYVTYVKSALAMCGRG